MSTKTEEADQKFRDWKKEIEERCNEHIQKHPEHKPVRPSKANKGFAIPNTVVQVQESIVNKGMWNVWKNGVLERSFEGPLAQLQATRLAAKLLDGTEYLVRDTKEGELPTMCIFCGGRYLHRVGCPDAKKQGPDFPLSSKEPE